MVSECSREVQGEAHEIVGQFATDHDRRLEEQALRLGLYGK